MAWVETWFPWWVWEEEEEGEDDWSILDKKEQEARTRLAEHSAMLRDLRSSVRQVAAPEKSRETFMLLEERIDSALRSNHTESHL